MSITGAFILYAVTWFMVFFCVFFLFCFFFCRRFVFVVFVFFVFLQPFLALKSRNFTVRMYAEHPMAPLPWRFSPLPEHLHEHEDPLGR